MQPVQDPFNTGAVVAAQLAPHALKDCEPTLRRLLVGTQMFVKLPDGRYRPRGCALGLAQCFDFSDFASAQAR